MHSNYQLRETHHADLSLSVHDRINALHRQADNLAPAVAESALDSGCTDRHNYDGLGPRQAKAWDLVAEAHGWNAISDKPEELAKAEAAERDGRSYRVGYGDNGFGVQELEEPVARPAEYVVREINPDGTDGQVVKTFGQRKTAATNWALDQRLGGNPDLAVRYEPPPAVSGAHIPDSERCQTCHRSAHTATNPGLEHGHPFKAKADPVQQSADEYTAMIDHLYAPESEGGHGLVRESVTRVAHSLKGAHRLHRMQGVCGFTPTALDAEANEVRTFHGPDYLAANAEPFTIDGQPACGESVDGGRCGRAPGHGPEHPHIVDSSTVRYGAGTGWTLAQARQAMAKIGAELQAAADSGALSRVLDEPEEPKPQANCAVACPAWCGASHGRPQDGTSHQLRRYIGKGRDGAEGWVTLYMVDHGQDNKILADLNGQIDIHVHWLATHKAAIRPLAEAEKFALDAEAFGRADIASMIRELAALAKGKPRTSPYTPPQAKAEPADPRDGSRWSDASQAAYVAEAARRMADRLKITRDPETSAYYVSRYTELVAFVKPSGELLKLYLPGGTLAGLLYKDAEPWEWPNATFRPVTRDHGEPQPYVSLALAVAQILTAASSR